MRKILLPALFALLSLDCFSQCAIQQSATVTPLPLNNTYTPGTVVTFCFKVDSFSQDGTNWFHGVVLNFGAGWDTSSIEVVSLPGGCDVNGIWGYYPSCTSSGSGESFGQGFYFDNTQGNINLVLDGIPGNNYGDDGTNCTNDSWKFCFTIQVKPDCSGGGDLSASATVTGDGTTGSWSNTSCAGVPFKMISNVTCGSGGCASPVGLTVTNVTATSVNLSWNSVGNAEGYKIFYHPNGVSAGVKKSSSSNSKLIKNLQPNTTYKWAVQTICSNNPFIASAFVPGSKFTTAPFRLSDDITGSLKMEIFPNPSSENATIAFTLMDPSPVIISLLDVNGRLVSEIKNAQYDEGIYQLSFVTKSFAAGTYLLQFTTNEESTVRKLVIEH